MSAVPLESDAYSCSLRYAINAYFTESQNCHQLIDIEAYDQQVVDAALQQGIISEQTISKKILFGMFHNIILVSQFVLLL